MQGPPKGQERLPLVTACGSLVNSKHTSISLTSKEMAAAHAGLTSATRALKIANLVARGDYCGSRGCLKASKCGVGVSSPAPQIYSTTGFGVLVQFGAREVLPLM